MEYRDFDYRMLNTTGNNGVWMGLGFLGDKSSLTDKSDFIFCPVNVSVGQSPSVDTRNCSDMTLGVSNTTLSFQNDTWNNLNGLMHPSWTLSWANRQCELSPYTAQASYISHAWNATRSNITANVWRAFTTTDSTDYQFTDGSKLNLFWGVGFLSSGVPNTTDTTKFANGYTTVAVGPLIIKCDQVQSGSSYISTFVTLMGAISAVAFFF